MHHVDKGARLLRPHLLDNLLGKPVELRRAVFEQGVNGDLPVEPFGVLPGGQPRGPVRSELRVRPDVLIVWVTGVSPDLAGRQAARLRGKVAGIGAVPSVVAVVGISVRLIEGIEGTGDRSVETAGVRPAETTVVRIVKAAGNRAFESAGDRPVIVGIRAAVASVAVHPVSTTVAVPAGRRRVPAVAAIPVKVKRIIGGAAAAGVQAERIVPAVPRGAHGAGLVRGAPAGVIPRAGSGPQGSWLEPAGPQRREDGQPGREPAEHRVSGIHRQMDRQPLRREDGDASQADRHEPVPPDAITACPHTRDDHPDHRGEHGDDGEQLQQRVRDDLVVQGGGGPGLAEGLGTQRVGAQDHGRHHR